jgi:oxygen-independent coproporphyrinogen-3 oxidase
VQQPFTPSVELTTEGSRSQQESSPITVRDLAANGYFAPKNSRATISSAYLHVPFCFHKCHYCDFYSIVDSRDRQGIFTDRLIHEITLVGQLVDFQPAETIFVGGGTPTLLAGEHWERLLDVLKTQLIITPATEFTVEANPETVTAELAHTLARGGVNRISIGAQSFNTEHLKTLERWHDPANVARSVDHFRKAGIDALNLDLIFAVPGQTLEHWLEDLHTAVALEPTHMSCYGLTYEPNTPMTTKMQRGRVTPVEQETEAMMYQATQAFLADAGYEHYEISAWAKPGARCEHNLRYWTNRNWWPFGPSASGHVNGTRWKNLPRLGSYLDSSDMPPIIDVERVDDDARVGEMLMLGLRLIDGMPTSVVDELLVLGMRGEARRAAIAVHVNDGLLQVKGDRLCLTQQGLLLADRVLADVI